VRQPSIIVVSCDCSSTLLRVKLWANIRLMPFVRHHVKSGWDDIGMRMQHLWDQTLDWIGDDGFKLHVYGIFLYKIIRNNFILKLNVWYKNRDERLEHCLVLDGRIGPFIHGNVRLAQVAHSLQNPTNCYRWQKTSHIGTWCLQIIFWRYLERKERCKESNENQIIEKGSTPVIKLFNVLSHGRFQIWNHQTYLRKLHKDSD
jgi:hypothetical protein